MPDQQQSLSPYTVSPLVTVWRISLYLSSASLVWVTCAWGHNTELCRWFLGHTPWARHTNYNSLSTEEIPVASCFWLRWPCINSELYTSSEVLLLILKVVEVMDTCFFLLINTLKTVNKIQIKCCLGQKPLYLKESLTSSGTEDILLFFFFYF